MDRYDYCKEVKRVEVVHSMHATWLCGRAGQDIFIKIHHCLSVRFDLISHHSTD